MNIRQKIFFSILGVILLMFISLVSIFVFHASSLREYRQVSHNLILENELQRQIVELVDVYNSLVIAPASTERLSAYQAIRQRVIAVFSELDVTVTNDDSRISYEGLKRTVESILADTDSGLSYLQNGDPTKALELYNTALYKRGFIVENTTSLLLTEINHLHEIQERLEKRYNEQLFVMLGWITFLIGAAVLYSVIFARRITKPIQILSRVSKEVSGGDYNVRIDKDIVSRQDEVGSLAQSFNTMLEALNYKITQVEKANDTVLETKRRLEDRNKELERFNKMVIGRELKMVELKRDIDALESKLRASVPTDAG